MKATGIVRRIDDLGRIVIPKEIRRTLKIQEGSPLEIYTNSDGDIIFRKYSPVGEMKELAEIYAETLSTTLGASCAVVDTEKILAVGGSFKKELKDKLISDRMRNFLCQRKVRNTNEAIQISMTSDKTASLTSMINTDGDPMGAVILFDIQTQPTANQQTVLKTVATLLGKQAQ